MNKINALYYTKGKFGKKFREIVDTDNENLYSKGRYPTKIKEDDLPEDYIKIRSRVILYMTGYVKTSGIADIKYKAMKLNHLFKDDYLYISYKEKLIMQKDSFGFYDYMNYDICICGNDIIPVVLGAEKYSNMNINEVKQQIEDKIEWYRKKYDDDYIEMFGDKKIDIFKMASERINKV